MKSKIKNRLTPRIFGQSSARTFLLMSALCLLSMVLSNSTFAQGVAAGTDISNKVLVTYSIGNTVQEPIESSPTGNSAPGIGNGQDTVFKVDRKVDLLVTGNNNANVSPGDSQAEVTFTLLNEGNDTQVFNLATNSALGTDDFDTSNCVSTVTSVSGTPLTGVILPTTATIKLKADQQATINVRCDIPPNSSGIAMQAGDNSLLSLVATAEKNSDGTDTSETLTPDASDSVDTIFADSNGSDDNNRDARHSARREYVVSIITTPPTLSIDKSIVSIIDPQGGNTSVVGAEVTYKIQITTVGTGTIDNVVITDPTPANMQYKPSTIKLDSVNQSDQNDVADNSDFGSTTANTATINLGSIAAGSQHEIQLTYIIN
ncbi:MAG: hypothetical protein L3J51_03245 [Cocleimonas sp.]|nr:hypothetical protein [Cocleimonas sp.]